MNTDKEKFKTINTYHVMVDIETLGLTPGSSIIQLSACSIFNDANYHFDSRISIKSNEAVGLVREVSTVNWWYDQEESLQRHIALTGTDSLYDTLFNFSIWLTNIADGDELLLWAKPASFDFKLLEAAYIACNLPVPWSRHQLMCAHTVFRMLEANCPEPEFLGNKHDALSDALHQARWLAKIDSSFKVTANG